MSGQASTTRDLEGIITDYVAVWNEADSTRRRTLAERVLTADGRYVDPQSDVSGPADFSDMVAAVQQQLPGHRIRLASGVDRHHDQVRFAWELVGPDGGIVLSGIDVGQLGGDGRLRGVTGFFGALPEPANA